MTSPNQEKSLPSLDASPRHLEFGDIKSQSLTHFPPSANLIIINRGTATLAGRVSTQVSWVSTFPPDFKIEPGQSSYHKVTLSTETPRSWKEQKYIYDYLLLINSNGGSFYIGGSYYSNGEINIANKGKKSFIHYYLLAAITAFIALLLLSLNLPLRRENKNDRNHANLFTQGAETFIAKLTIDPLTTTAYPIKVPTIEKRQMIDDIPVLGGVIRTFTPWPSDGYPNPENFVKRYYEEINKRNYKFAWEMLSSDFKTSCCNQGGNNPFLIYTNWWNTIYSVEVLSVYIQAWNSNPAEVYVKLGYTSKKGEISEAFHIISLVSDEKSKALLIDKVK